MNDPTRGKWTSASNAQADLLCPGRHLAQLGMPDEETEATKFGQELHDALAEGDDENLDTKKKDLFESCERIVETIGSFYFANDWPQCEVLKETRMWVHFEGPMEQALAHSGQVDRVCFHLGLKKAVIFEFKSLPGEVAESSRNQQLRDQAVLVMENLFGPSVVEIATVVVQPLITHRPGVCLYSRDELMQAFTELEQRVRRSNDPTSPRIAGDIQCKYCRARKKCPEYGQHAGYKTPVAKSLVDVPMASWTGQQCAQFLSGKAVATKWLKDATEMCEAREKAFPGSIPGWELADGDTREEIKDPQAVFDRFHALGGGLEDFMGCVKVLKGRLNDALAKVTGKKGQELKQLLDRLLAGLTEEKQNKPSLKQRKDRE